MTDARSIAIADALTADRDAVQKLLAMNPEEAVEEFRKQGYDFTVEELSEFHNELREVSERLGASGELNEEVLSGVSGGCGRCFVLGALVAGAAILGGW